MPSTEPLSRCRGLATEHCVRRATAQGDTHVQGKLRHEGPEGPSQMQRVEEWFRQREQHEQEEENTWPDGGTVANSVLWEQRGGWRGVQRH